jgi:predicted DNA-binding transcriptional regulator AlpA
MLQKTKKNEKRYLTVAELKQRWGGVSQMFIERRVREPGFPQPIRLPGSRIRLFLESDIEAYERSAVVDYRRQR